jgi:signal transduction histidine kinase
MARDLKEPSLRSNRKSSKASSNHSSPIIGSGHMADLTRAFDWKGTVLGAAETWPDTLLTTVNLLLASRHPMFLWWGPELVQFYNDGYRPSIRGDKHPSALGQRGADCWPEIWPIIGPQIEAVMRHGESTWNTNQLVPINRNGKLEEVFWTYGYSPVRDKDGGVQGTLVVQSEILDRKRAEISLRELTGRLLRAQDEERRHMARELHDHAGQTLVAMALNLEALVQDGNYVPRSIRIIKEVQKLSDDLSKEIRTLSYLAASATSR